MYAVLGLLFAIGSLGLLGTGLARRQRGRIALGTGIGAAGILFFSGLDVWGDALWFGALGYARRYWVATGATTLGWVLGAGLAAGLVLGLTRSLPQRRVRFTAAGIGAGIGALWGLAVWDVGLRWAWAVDTGTADPILGRDVGFYLFRLPFYDAVQGLVLLLALLALTGQLLALSVHHSGDQIVLRPFPSWGPDARTGWHTLFVAGAAGLGAVAWQLWLARYHLMYSAAGVVTGPGWTDVTVRLPAYDALTALALLLALVLLLPPLRRRWARLLPRRARRPGVASYVCLGQAGAVLAVAWVLLLGVVPSLFQWLYVEPNEITIERPYIAHNIAFTRRAYGLQKAEERQLQIGGDLTRETVARNRALFGNVRLWDWRALKDVYRQFQEIRLYYRFSDVEIDRYHIDGRYRQVMISAREMDLSELPEPSRTFVNQRFKYTHGYGITLSDVSEFTSEGLPHLLVKDLPARAEFPELELTRPQIYYGEVSTGPVVANSSEPEFDYPKGDENAYNHYDGHGGVALSSLWRRFIYGWRFDGTRLFMSQYATADSRLLFHREIRERIATIAPFLRLDDDPYIVLVDGRLYWIVDAYTTSSYYPYSAAFHAAALRKFSGVNYLRNAVKVVVDAYDGDVRFYVFDPQDPVVRVWSRIYPDLFRPRQDMPPGLRAHVRYPVDMLLAQGLVYTRYHMADPSVFYNQEDLWVRATEQYYGRSQPVAPYYIMWHQPGSERLEFTLMMPFTPKERQVMIGWIAGLCDGDDYGRLLVYKLPKETRVLGPQQVETKIDQDPYLSGQLTLWDQRGSKVIRGNVLVIPVDRTLLYVEPIYLQAETAAYPELRLVVVMHEDQLSYAPTFDAALEGLFGAGARHPLATALPGLASPGTGSTMSQKAAAARDAFHGYLDAMSQSDFQAAGRALERLRGLLDELAGGDAPPGPQAADSAGVPAVGSATARP